MGGLGVGLANLANQRHANEKISRDGQQKRTGRTREE
jgi:hypothetical protein